MKCCGCNHESSWTEAVLFEQTKDDGLDQVAYTEPEDQYIGEWELELDGTTYFIEVVDGGDIDEPALAIISPEHVISRNWKAEGWTINKEAFI